MSHTTTLKTIKIVDIDALKDAVAFLQEKGVKCHLEENSKARLWSTSEKCDYVLKLPQTRFDVGFRKQPDGSYVPVFDAHAGIVRNVIGSPSNVVGDTPEEQMTLNISKLVDLYGVCAARNQLNKDRFGYTSDVEYNEEDDSYTLTVRERF